MASEATPLDPLSVPADWAITAAGMSCDGLHALDYRAYLDPEGRVVVRDADGRGGVIPEYVVDWPGSFSDWVLSSLRAGGIDVDPGQEPLLRELLGRLYSMRGETDANHEHSGQTEPAEHGHENGRSMTDDEESEWAVLAAQDQLDAEEAEATEAWAVAHLNGGGRVLPLPLPGVRTLEPATVALPFEDAGDLLRRDMPLPRYDLDGLIAPGAVTVLGGYVGAGKSPLTARMIKALLTGDAQFIGIAHGTRLPDDYRIVYLTQESEYTFKPLLEGARLTPETVAGKLHIVYLHAALGTGKTWPDIVAEAVELIGPRGLLVVDPLSDWAMVRSEDDNAVMGEAFRPIVQAIGGGRSALVVAHTWKSFDAIRDEDTDVAHIRGAGAIVSNASIILLYKKPTEKGLGDRARFFKVARNRFGNDLEPRYLELEEDGTLRKIEVMERALADISATQELVLHAITAAGVSGITKTDLHNETGLHWRKIADAVDALLAGEKIVSRGKARSRKDPLVFVAVSSNADETPLPDPA